jgi:transposase-like protein
MGATVRETSAYRRNQCSKTFLEPQEKPLDGMYLPLAQAELVLQLLLEGNSVSSVERVTGVHHGTILKLLVLAGEKCEKKAAEMSVHFFLRVS